MKWRFDYIDNQAHATSAFKAAMAKLQVLGQNMTELIDCSEVCPFVFMVVYPLQLLPTLTSNTQPRSLEQMSRFFVNVL